jgi:hypothetical protein
MNAWAGNIFQSVRYWRSVPRNIVGGLRRA